MLDTSRLRKELEAGRLHKKQRVDSSWKPNDDAYNGIVPKYSKMTYNFHLPILSGFEDTLIAKIDEAPLIHFGSGQAGETRLGRQVDALWKVESDKPDTDYAMADLQSKRHAARYGRAFLKTVGTKKPFSIDVLSVDPYDMVTDPNGGGELEDHRFCAQDGIFRSAKQLLDGVESGMYDKKAVARLLAGPPDSKEEFKLDADLQTRFSALKQSGYAFDSAGEDLYRLCEHVTVIDGDRYLVTWNPESEIVLKCDTLRKRYGCDLLPWTSWAPLLDNKVFWSKAPDDDVRQAAEAMRVTLMEMMVNVQKQNWGTKVFDPERISADQLAVSAPNGLIVAKAGAASLPGGLDGAYKVIQTPNVSIALNVVEFLDRFVGQKAGVTPDAQGTSAEDKVGIYFGNIEQLADRMGLQSRYYRNAWRRVGTRFLYQAKRNLTGKVPVETIGPRGSEMTVLLARNIDPTMGVTVTGGSAEAAVSEAKRKERGAALSDLLANPATGGSINLTVAVGEKLKSAGYEEDEVTLLTNKDAGSEYRDQQLRAQESVELLLEGKKPPLYEGANTTFVRSILDSAREFTNGEGPEHERLIAYAQAHIKIAARNSAIEAYEKAMLEGIGPSAPPPEESADPMNPNPTPDVPIQPIPGTTEGAPLQG